MKVLSGIQPTGRFHWGNYFGAIRQYIALQGNEQSFYFIADLHALTTVRDPAELRQNVADAALDLLALGLKLTWLLMTITQMHLLEKCHAFKDKKAKGIAADAGLFTYPVLMAADILIYDSTTVPVGADQIQHIEVTRDLAQRFNSLFGETLILPEPYVLDASAKVPGVDREKMSKSYGNTIAIFADEKSMKKKIMGIVTDSTPVEAPKDPDNNSIYQLYKLFAPAGEAAAMADNFRAGGTGYGDFKKQLFGTVWEYFAPMRAKRAELAADPGYVDGVLRRGEEHANALADKVMARVEKAVGLRG